MASAAPRIFSSSILPPKQFQLFQPSGGVRQMVWPDDNAERGDSLAGGIAAVKVTACSPALATEPVILPVAESSVRPSGSPWAVTVIGRWPVTGR